LVEKEIARGFRAKRLVDIDKTYRILILILKNVGAKE